MDYVNEPSENHENLTPTLTLIPWLLAAKNDNRLLQHRTMFRASNVKNAFSLAVPIQCGLLRLYWCNLMAYHQPCAGVAIVDAIAVVVQRFLGIR